MFAITGAVLFAIIALLTVLVICGAPLGAFTMGGQYRILPKSFRIVGVVSLFIQLFAITIVLQSGGFLPLWFSARVTKSICIFFAAYLCVNTLMNALSKSKKERCCMTPLSAAASVCFWITALSM